MVEIVFSGMCEGCRYADLELSHMEFDDYEVFWSVSCKHDISCNRWQREKYDGAFQEGYEKGFREGRTRKELSDMKDSE